MFNVTESAINEIKQYLDEENKYLRVYVEGGGCSGFRYGFDFEESLSDDDFEIPLDGFSILIDSFSMQYLDTATLNFKEDIMGHTFTIENPTAQTTCGCGSSFSV